MTEYKINGEFIIKKNNDKQIVLSALEIYDLQDELSSLSIRFSKLSLDSKINLFFIDSKIFIGLYVLKKGKQYKVPLLCGYFNDYIIIDSVWHFVSFDKETFSLIINKLGINLDDSLTFVQYLNLKSELKKANIEYVDKVNDKVSEIKAFSPNEIINEEIKAELFTYQNIGFNWLSFMYRNNCGAILADEMGLGKTLQIISLMVYLKRITKNIHFMVVCPLSLLENWKREIEKFAPSLSVTVHHSSNRTGSYLELMKKDVVITSYSNAQSDLGMINMIDWDLLVVDEAQNIKNPHANRTKYIKQIKSKCSVAVTGTPFENHIEDIWSIVDFILPNYLGKLGPFIKEFGDDIESAERIEPLITPLMLRRRVVEVADDLPDRIDIPQPIIMGETEASLYEGKRKDALESLSELKIDKIQKLRMFCTHPYVYDNNFNDDPAKISSKYQRLCEILEEIVDNEEKILIFTSFNKMNDLLVSDLHKRFGVPVFSITGSTEVGDRQKIIDKFTVYIGSAILVLNPKAAGAGLNITAANHVIHYNLEWNPAIEDQASARSYRRGQDKNVFIYRLFYVGTIEEIINERISRKREISEAAIIGNQGEMNKEDLDRALRISPIGGSKNA